MSAFKILALSARCILTTRPAPRECVRIVALAALVAATARDDKPAAKLWGAHLTAAFQRAMAAKSMAKAMVFPTPWMDMLGSNAIVTAAVIGIIGAALSYVWAR
jgi:hypothetical protein